MGEGWGGGEIAGHCSNLSPSPQPPPTRGGGVIEVNILQGILGIRFYKIRREMIMRQSNRFGIATMLFLLALGPVSAFGAGSELICTPEVGQTVLE